MEVICGSKIGELSPDEGQIVLQIIEAAYHSSEQGEAI